MGPLEQDALVAGGSASTVAVTTSGTGQRSPSDGSPEAGGGGLELDAVVDEPGGHHRVAARERIRASAIRRTGSPVTS